MIFFSFQSHIKYEHIILIILLICCNNQKMFFLLETIIPIKNLIFIKINERFINKKIYIGKK
jgi:hypothetical protein